MPQRPSSSSRDPPTLSGSDPSRPSSPVESVDWSASESSPKKKRHQVKKACTNCAAACKKCEDSRPCERCIKHHIEDSCVDVARRPRKKGYKRGPYKKQYRPGFDQLSPDQIKAIAMQYLKSTGGRDTHEEQDTATTLTPNESRDTTPPPSNRATSSKPPIPSKSLYPPPPPPQQRSPSHPQSPSPNSCVISVRDMYPPSPPRAEVHQDPTPDDPRPPICPIPTGQSMYPAPPSEHGSNPTTPTSPADPLPPESQESNLSDATALTRPSTPTGDTQDLFSDPHEEFSLSRALQDELDPFSSISPSDPLSLLDKADDPSLSSFPSSSSFSPGGLLSDYSLDDHFQHQLASFAGSFPGDPTFSLAEIPGVPSSNHSVGPGGTARRSKSPPLRSGASGPLTIASLMGASTAKKRLRTPSQKVALEGLNASPTKKPRRCSLTPSQTTTEEEAFAAFIKC